jgi:hypothetical protein
MGWANCGTDRNGRKIGYAVEATCDHPGCKAKIDRGLSYACGGMHGEDVVGCEKYFCEGHLATWVRWGDREVQVCDACKVSLLADDWVEDEEEGLIVERATSVKGT